MKIMKTRDHKVKFKVRCSKYLYTLVVTDKEKADKLKQSLPPGETPPHIMIIRTALLKEKLYRSGCKRTGKIKQEMMSVNPPPTNSQGHTFMFCSHFIMTLF